MNVALSNPLTIVRSWLDIEIHPPQNFETLRWKWLGVLVIPGALLPMDCSAVGDVSAMHPPLLAAFIAACWHRSPVATKAGIAFWSGCVVFLHRELPMPGIGYGFLHFIEHSAMPSIYWNWLLVTLGLGAVLPMVMVMLIHYLILAITVCVEFLNTAWQNVRQLLFEIPEATERSPSVTPVSVETSS